MIHLQNVFKKFGQRLAVDYLSLEVPPGEIYGLLGHNGAGKSTAIGMMLGQVWPSAGEIRISGHHVTNHRKLALQKVGAIFESPCFYDYLSGRRNLEILSSYTAPTPRQRIDEVIEWVGLKGREGGKVQTYSHGMRARLALAQALLPKPELLILDEPSDGLDPEGDFMFLLLLSALWVSWRDRFSSAGLLLGALAMFGGSLFLAAYLFVVTRQAQGNMKEVMLGKSRAALI